MAWREAVDALNLDPEHLDALGEECRQLSLARGATALGVSDLLTETAGSPLEPTYRTYQALFDRYGLTDVTLLRQLPVAYLVAGYTRVSAHAQAVNRRGTNITTRFRFFPPGRTGSGGKLRMYGVRTETEGQLFRLDPGLIVQWLVDSGIVSDPQVADAAAAQRWLFQVIDPVIDIFNAPENRISRAVLGLTHSFAHRAMKSLGARCGLNVDSLTEYLFPSNGAFLIYANTRSEFILGGSARLQILSGHRLASGERPFHPGYAAARRSTPTGSSGARRRRLPAPAASRSARPVATTRWGRSRRGQTVAAPAGRAHTDGLRLGEHTPRPR